MAVRNIDKGFYKVSGGGGSTDIPPTTVNLSWSGGLIKTTQAVFSKTNGVVNVQLAPIYGPAVSIYQILCVIPDQFRPKHLSAISYPVPLNIANNNIVIGFIVISFPSDEIITSPPDNTVQFNIFPDLTDTVHFTVGNNIGLQYQTNFSYLAD